ncbi:hypothetical protein [Acinetobacter sp. P1(2025)]|uniref:hypothetical protein n=1 Tax=Acinetobacter sp. P1(2025) TaxID=3446120 RepID=UPI003F535D83
MKTPIIKEVHISTIAVGDTVMHKGQMLTVCRKDISKSFCGHSIFGDSYRSGRIPVKRVLFAQWRSGQFSHYA